jgi:hypothetical protein
VAKWNTRFARNSTGGGILRFLRFGNILAFISRFGLFRGSLVILSAFTASFFYSFAASSLSPDRNVYTEWRSINQVFTFYTGSPEGFYASIGQGMQNGDAEVRLDLALRETSGGEENAIRVLTSANSFGLVQEETISQDDFIREHVQYVTPLYMERVHAIYCKEKVSTEQLRLDTSLDASAQDFFRNARINIGVVGIGHKDYQF